MSVVAFREFGEPDKLACLAVFDANCPEYFAPNEREDYLRFLTPVPAGYTVCVSDGGVAGAFGVFPQRVNSASLNWIMIAPEAQGLGIGSRIMALAVQQGRSMGAVRLQIAASHKSAPFFCKFGAVKDAFIDNGWGKGMHRVDMTLQL